MNFRFHLFEKHEFKLGLFLIQSRMTQHCTDNWEFPSYYYCAHNPFVFFKEIKTPLFYVSQLRKVTHYQQAQQCRSIQTTRTHTELKNITKNNQESVFTAVEKEEQYSTWHNKGLLQYHSLAASYKRMKCRQTCKRNGVPSCIENIICSINNAMLNFQQHCFTDSQPWRWHNGV